MVVHGRNRREAHDQRDEAIRVLDNGRTLVMSNRTNLIAGTVHKDLGQRLVLLGVAEYLPDPEREGFVLETHIRKREVR